MMASLQDWDALYSYTYRDFGQDYENTALKRYFHLIGRANLLVHAPAGAMMFRQGLLAPATSELRLVLPTKHAAQLACDEYRLSTFWQKLGVDPGAAWLRRVTLVPDGQRDEAAFTGEAAAGKGLRTSDCGVIRWHPNDPDGAWCAVAAPAVRLLVGHVAGRSFDVGDTKFTLGARSWPKELPAYACVSLVALDAKPIDVSRKLLFAVFARTENQGMQWSVDRTSLPLKGWGRGPTVSEAVPLSLELPGDPVDAQALDALGRPMASLSTAGKTVMLRAEDKTLWALLTRP